ncbi:protein-export chaperone SecB [Paenirhodobacter populi]|uniref:Protein-export protein SecB n=1 Tax=Paenirhodobacter populi TaxID=2306993 RepID=A0A443JHB3_9RHOB|nr:protein-export chaperone SecB [Sinirhodobacter populi]RWR11477.1 protein-export chaperone SecB [Sinirhodobacter populi]RWR13866.1 protein-export chaperone SecB [Sinirhodobacter populi]RWR19902.1 protein-export chaperone SecB [Sinirhodobacter populi]RWR28683.1 protein-export chaperone SecB [Sinirhodobacter populi]
MTEQVPNGAPAPGMTQVRMQILAQYVRDMSFENAVAIKGVQATDVQPEMALAVNLDARKRPVENQYDVIIKLKVTASNKADKATLYILEVEYGGVFHIEGIPEEQLHPFLLIECPRQLFPFVRRIVSDVTRDGGFPSFNIEPIDFVGLYRNELARRAQAQQQQPTSVS